MAAPQIVLGLAGFGLQLFLAWKNKPDSAHVGKIAEFRVPKTDMGSFVPSFDGQFRMSGALTYGGPISEYVNSSRVGKGLSRPKQFEYRYTQTTQHLVAYTETTGIAGWLKVFLGSNQEVIFDASGTEGAIARIDGNRIITDDMTLYFGVEGQPPDSTLIEIEGAANVNSLERVAYAVLRDFPRDNQMHQISAILTETPMSEIFPVTAVTDTWDRGIDFSTISADGQFVVSIYNSSDSSEDAIIVYNLSTRTVVVHETVTNPSVLYPPVLTLENHILWYQLGLLYSRTWPNYPDSSDKSIGVPRTGGVQSGGVAIIHRIDALGVIEWVLACTNTTFRLFDVEPAHPTTQFTQWGTWGFSEVFPEGFPWTTTSYGIATDADDTFFLAIPVSTTSMRLTLIAAAIPRILDSLTFTLPSTIHASSDLRACYEPVTNSVVFLASAAGPGNGLVIRYELDTAIATDLLLSGTVDLADNAANWIQGPSGKNLIYASNGGTVVYEIDLVEMTEIRTISVSDFTDGHVGGGFIYDSINHVILGTGSPPTTDRFMLLDRVSGSGEITIANMVTRRTGHTQKLVAADINVTGLTGSYPGSVVEEGQSIAQYIAAVQELTGFDVLESQESGLGKVFFRDQGGAVDATIPLADLGARPLGSRRVDPLIFEDAAEEDLPAILTLTLPEPEIDFNSNVSIHQRSPDAFSGLDDQAVSSRQVALTATQRAAAVERLLFEAHANQTPLTIALTAKWSWLRPGHRVSIVGRTATFRAFLQEGQRGTAGVIRFKVRTEAVEAFDTVGTAPVLLGDRTRTVAQLQSLAVAVVDAPAPVDSLVNPQGPPNLFILASRYSDVGSFDGANVLRKQSDGSFTELAEFIGPQHEAKAYGYLSIALAVTSTPTAPDATNSLHIVLHRGTITSTPLAEVIDSTSKGLVLIRSSDGAWEWLQHSTMALQGDGSWLSLDQGSPAMADASAVKVLGTEMLIELYKLLLEIVGESGLIRRFEDGALFGGLLESAYRAAMVNTFGGGVNEVMRDIIAMAGLGLPKAHRRPTETRRRS